MWIEAELTAQIGPVLVLPVNLPELRCLVGVLLLGIADGVYVSCVSCMVGGGEGGREYMDEPLVWKVGAGDLPAVAETFGAAGLDEAVHAWVVPDESERRKRVETGAEQAVGWLEGVLAGGEILVVGRSGVLEGVSLWRHVDGPPEPTEEEAEQQAAFLEATYGEYAPRMQRVFELTERRHPYDEPHLYLMSMVVLPAARGHGLGGVLLRHRLMEADAERLPVYLEASTRRNQALYERLGFVAMGDPIVLPEGGPNLQPMWRPVNQ